MLFKILLIKLTDCSFYSIFVAIPRVGKVMHILCKLFGKVFRGFEVLLLSVTYY